MKSLQFEHYLSLEYEFIKLIKVIVNNEFAYSCKLVKHYPLQ